MTDLWIDLPPDDDDQAHGSDPALEAGVNEAETASQAEGTEEEA